MDKNDLQGLLLDQFVGPYLYVRPDYDSFETSVVCERVNSEGYVTGNYRVIGVDHIERGLDKGEYEKLGSYPDLTEARSAVAKLNDNPDPNPDN